MSLKIPGIEGQEPAQTGDNLDASQETENPGETAPTPEQKPEPEMQRKTQGTAKKSKSFAAMFSGATLVISVAALGYAFTLQQKVGVLNAQLAKAQAAADSALKTAKSIPAPRDFTPDIARVEATVVSKFRVTDEYLQKTIPEEIKKIAALQARLTAENKETANSVSSVAQAIEQIRQSGQKNEGRFTNVITILRNQDRVLRRLVRNESPEAQ